MPDLEPAAAPLHAARFVEGSRRPHALLRAALRGLAVGGVVLLVALGGLGLGVGLGVGLGGGAAHAATPGPGGVTPVCDGATEGVTLGDYIAACGPAPYVCTRIEGVSDATAEVNDRAYRQTLAVLRDRDTSFTLFLPSSTAYRAALAEPRFRTIAGACGTTLAEVSAVGAWPLDRLRAVNGYLPTIADRIVPAVRFSTLTELIERIDAGSYRYTSAGVTRLLEVAQFPAIGVSASSMSLLMIYVDANPAEVGVGRYQIDADRWLQGARIERSLTFRNGVIHLIDCMLGVSCPAAPR